MKHQPELHDDFLSSAGVPTIPLKTTKKRSFMNTAVYTIVALLIMAVMLGGVDVIYGVLSGFVTLYFAICVVLSALVAVIGITIKNKWLFLIGVVGAALSIGVVLSGVSFGVSVAGSLMIAVFIYRWYTAKYHYESAQWPAFIGVLSLVFGLLLIIVQLQVIAAVFIAPVLLVVICAMIAWELWGNVRKHH
ncbi:MAG: hypothetical protein ACK5GU_06810 [Chloroflexota bacterium]|jgi:hypothetical protein